MSECWHEAGNKQVYLPMGEGYNLKMIIQSLMWSWQPVFLSTECQCVIKKCCFVEILSDNVNYSTKSQFKGRIVEIKNGWNF